MPFSTILSALLPALSLLAQQPPVSPAPQIRLAPAMVQCEEALGDAAPLVDEQDARSKGGTPQSALAPGWEAWKYPLHYLVDLGRPYRLRRVSLYDGQGTGTVDVATGEPFRWQPQFTDPLTSYQVWNDHELDTVTRYVRVTVATPGLSLPEITLYGDPLPDTRPRAVHPAAALKTVRTHPTFDQFVGTNAFIDDPQDKMQVVGFVREYHSWAWDEGDGSGAYLGYPNNELRLNPSAAAGGNAWFFDTYYGNLRRANVEPVICTQGNVSWLVGKDVPNAVKPVQLGRDAGLPASYIEHAAYLYQLAARYGTRKIADYNLKLAPNQPRVSGLGLVRYLEDWNEQDRTWEGRTARFTPYEYAAMASADRDGHQGILGPGIGIKTADPQMKLVMGGIAGLNLAYLDGIKRWCDFNRNGNFALDVINVHHYSNDGGEQGMGKTGISPEADHLRKKLVPLVQWRDRNAPRAELWVTEFGYDTHPNSPQRAPAIGPYSQEEVQAQWLVRSYLAFSAAGIDRAAQYMLRDVNPTDATQFATSGMVTQKGEWKPKPSWFYVSTLKNQLAGMRFDREIPSGNPNVTVYRFQKPRRAAYVVWCPTSNGMTIPNYRLPLLGVKAASGVSLAVGKPTGVPFALPLVAGAVTLSVSERPQFVFCAPPALPLTRPR